MAHAEIQSSKEPIRLFKSDFLEFFSHIHPPVIIALWSPVMLYFLISAILRYEHSFSPIYIPIGVLAGILVWTFAEYTLHRFVFHFKPRSPFQERLSFLFHGVHHAQPMSKTRLVMPPAVSIPLAFLFFAIFYLVIVVLFRMPHWLRPAFAGFAIGYLTYDTLHYSMHHFKMQRGYGQFIRKYHMRHHVQTPDKRFGVSSPLWDFVFATAPEKLP